MTNDNLRLKIDPLHGNWYHGAADTVQLEPELTEDQQSEAVLAAALWKCDNMTSPSDDDWSDVCQHAKVVKHWLDMYHYGVFKIDDRPPVLSNNIELPMSFIWGLVAGLSLSVIIVFGSVMTVVMKWTTG